MLARRVGINVTYLSKIENDRQPPSKRVLRSLAEALETDADRLMVMAGRVPARVGDVLLASPPGDGASPFEGLAPPRYRTRFIDREEDRQRLEQLVGRGDHAAGASVISVTGPPGIGKTRLVAEVMERIGRDRPVAWITVREHDAERIRAAVTLVQHQPGLILVLDDAERDLEACTEIARDMVARGATVVATSRQPLRVYGQRYVRLASLTVPDRHQRPAPGDGTAPDLSRLQDEASVQLFVDRATLAWPDFQLDRGNAAAVFDVCRWLDGLPLAIELAALRLGQMTVADLAARTANLLPWLTGNTPDVPDRHVSLGAAIGWSFDTLGERQRAVARRLSLLQSTFSLADATSLAAEDPRERDFVETTVIELVERSLLVWRENADGRAVYRWLSPIRQYGHAELRRAADLDPTIERHRSWVRKVVASLEEDLPRRESEWERLAELTPELMSAVYELPAAEQADAMNRMTDALSKTLQFGNLAEHVSWFSERFSERLSERADSGGPEVFREAGMLARVRGELDEAHRNFEQAYRIAVNNRDDAAQANAALDLAENAADLTKYDEAQEHVDKAAALYEKLEDSRGRVEVLNLRGRIEQETGDLGVAERLFTDALRLARKVEDRRLIAYSLHSLGVCDHLLRRVTAARAWLEESLRIRDNMRNQRGVARVVEALALVESAMENHELVLQLIGAARQYRRSSGVLRIARWWQEQLDAVEQEARVSLVSTPEAVDHYLQVGSAMTVAEAGDLASQITSPLPPGPLEDPVTDERLRRAVPTPFVERGQAADAVAAAARDEAPTALDLAAQELVDSGGQSTDAYRRLHRSRLLALGVPIGPRIADMLCFAIDPHQYRGVIVPVFASGRALAKALELRPEWASLPVVEIRLEQLRSVLVQGETAVVNPWTASEFRFSPAEQFYAPSIDAISSIEAPASSSRVVSSS